MRNFSEKEFGINGRVRDVFAPLLAAKVLINIKSAPKRAPTTAALKTTKSIIYVPLH